MGCLARIAAISLLPIGATAAHAISIVTVHPVEIVAPHVTTVAPHITPIEEPHFVARPAQEGEREFQPPIAARVMPAVVSRGDSEGQTSDDDTDVIGKRALALLCVSFVIVALIIGCC